MNAIINEKVYGDLIYDQPYSLDDYQQDMTKKMGIPKEALEEISRVSRYRQRKNVLSTMKSL